MTPEGYLEAIETEAERLLAAAPRDLDAAVPGCPGWLVSDVVEHLAVVYLHKIACTELLRPPDPWPPEPPHDDPVAWLAAAKDELLDELRRRGPDAPSYTWYPPDQTVGFWFRRMAHETAMHRVDVEQATGEAAPVPDELALDGIDELLTVMVAGSTASPDEGRSERPLILRSGERWWQVDLGGTEVEVDSGNRADASADVVADTVEGAPSDLLLWLWGRAGRGDADLDSVGIVASDPAAAHALRSVVVRETQ